MRKTDLGTPRQDNVNLLSNILKTAVKFEYLPFTILLFICALSLVSRIVLLLR